MLTFNSVRRIARALPEVSESKIHGKSALKVNGKFWLASRYTPLPSPAAPQCELISCSVPAYFARRRRRTT